MSYASDWGDVWNKSIQAFDRYKRHAIKELEEVVGKTGPLVKSLDTLDKNDPNKFDEVNRPAERKKALAASEKEFKAFKKVRNTYEGFVDLAIAATSKNAQPEVYRELKVIKAHLDWMDKRIANKLNLLSKASQDMNRKVTKKITEKEDALRDGGADDSAVKAGTQMLKYAKLLVAFPTAAAAGAAVAKKAIQAIKANPTPATYKDEMEHGGRNYTQQMNNAITLAQHPDCPPELTQLLQGLIPHDAHLREFGGGAKRQAPMDADANAILALTKEYSQLVKATVGYIDVVNAYIAKNKKKLGLK